MIKEAKFQDLERCVSLACEFANTFEAISGDTPKNHSDAFKSFLLTAMSDNSYCIFVGETTNSMLVGGTQSFPIIGGNYALELMWWIAPEHRNLKLAKTFISSFEGWAKQKGLDRVIMGSAPSMKSASKFYSRMGYDPFESTYIRRF
jgi:GNAT superfamily N-acetyltransferase